MEQNKFSTQFAQRVFQPHFKNVPAPPSNALKSELVVETVYSYTDDDEAETNKLDPTDLRWNLAANLDTINCHNQFYDVVEELFKSGALFGRGTWVWLVSGESGCSQILKDSNVLKSHKRTKAAFLMYMNACPKHCPYIPTLVASEILDHSESRRDPLLFVPCTEGLSAIVATKHIKHLSGVEALSEDLSEVRSKIELLGVILDITRAIQFLGEHDTAHQDISYNNIMLRTQPLSASEKIAFGGSPGTNAKVSLNSRIKAECRPGLLIDFNFAGFLDPSLKVLLSSHKCCFTDGPGPTSPTSFPSTSNPKVVQGPLHVKELGKNDSGYGAHTGTAPFMVLPLLLHSAPHKIGFNLENFGKLRDGKGILVQDNHYAPISAWFNPHLSFVDLGHLKTSQVHLHIKHSIFKYISSTFHDLKPTMKKLWQALYPSVQSVSNQTDTTSDYAALLAVAQLQPQDACNSFITILEEEIKCLFLMGDVKKRPSSRQANYDEADYADVLPSPTISKLDNAATIQCAATVRRAATIHKHVTFISQLTRAVSTLAALERVLINQIRLTEDYWGIEILVGGCLTLSGNDDFSDKLDDIDETDSPQSDAPWQKRVTEHTEQLPALPDDEYSESFFSFISDAEASQGNSMSHSSQWQSLNASSEDSSHPSSQSYPCARSTAHSRSSQEPSGRVLPNDSLQLTAILKKENNHIRNQLCVARDKLAEVTKERDGLVVAQATLQDIFQEVTGFAAIRSSRQSSCQPSPLPSRQPPPLPSHQPGLPSPLMIPHSPAATGSALPSPSGFALPFIYPPSTLHRDDYPLVLNWSQHKWLDSERA
ncbi:hypothetical protein DXG01_004076 [Tephrocybe rancida]|nr:hypothetical protein DXG01_004076 [Tephrocybe rancida]